MRLVSLFGGVALGLAAGSALGGGGALEIRNGYFWDPATAEYFIPRGIGYQTWNSAVGADQTEEQLDYDFAEFKKLHCNSVRCEMVWSEVETSRGGFDWTKPDRLVAAAEKHDLKLFILIGFQYAPQWFPTNATDSWVAVDQRGDNSVVVNYEHPEARAAYSNYIHRVTSRYADRTVIGGWILGNEYACFDLWTTTHYNLGYDPYSLASFRRFLAEAYAGDVAALNRNWQSGYTSFAEIPMPTDYPRTKLHPEAYDRFSPRYHDLIRWRERSIGDYVALGSRAAQLADPNHLRTYSMVGGLFIGADENYTCEDARTIVERCRIAGAPLDFWAINNYAWATLGAELRTGDFGISRHRADAGLPVLISETGHSTTDDLLIGAAERQGAALPGQMYEALMSGALGTHIFTWNDRELFGGAFVREKGFGIVNENRTTKSPVYTNIVNLFRRMEEINVDRLIGGSVNPPADVDFVWGEAARMGWPRANQENAMLWGVLRRLGYQPEILTDEGFRQRAYTNAAALVLSRCYKMDPADLEQLRTDAPTYGFALHATTDLPGQFDVYDRPNPAWGVAMSELFGVDVTGASVGYDLGVVNWVQYTPLHLQGANGGLGGITNGYSDRIQTWKIWDGVKAAGGRTVATHTGYNQRYAGSPLPALVVYTNGASRTALNTFALADLDYDQNQAPPTHDWDYRARWVRAIYRDQFQIIPPVEVVAGVGASYVIPDYRICANGTVLISLLNGVTSPAQVTVRAPGLLPGKVVEDLTRGGTLPLNPDGTVSLALAGDEYVLLYVYNRTPAGDESLVNASPNKVWVQAAPAVVWPRDARYAVTLGHETHEPLDLVLALERLSWPPAVVAEVSVAVASGSGTNVLEVTVPSATFNDLAYRSSAEGGSYRWRAQLRSGSVARSETTLPVRLAWGVRPLAPLPASVVGGEGVEAELKWEDLPSYEAWGQGTPLDRAARWETYREAEQHYVVTLEMRDSQGSTRAVAHHPTRNSYETARVQLNAPDGFSGPVEWLAYLRPDPAISLDYYDNFEHRGPGEVTTVPDCLRPYDSIYSYADPAGAPAQYLNRGVGMSQPPFLLFGQQFGFLVFSNPPSVGAWSGFGMVHTLVPPGSPLPTDPREWSNHVYSVRVRVTDDADPPAFPACLVELQLNDIHALELGAEGGGQIQFLQPFVPGPDGWMEIHAPLDQFRVTPHKGFFSSGALSALVLNFQMLEKGRTYVAYVDDLRLEGPEGPLHVWDSRDIRDSFEHQLPGNRTSAPDTLGWGHYSYPDGGYVLDWGVQTRAKLNPVDPNLNSVTNLLVADPWMASEGLQSAFLVVTNPPGLGDTSGFGLVSGWSEPWSLPAATNRWADYRFSFDFREADGKDCVLEMQLKSGDFNWIQFSRDYAPGPDGWDRLEASLDRFVTPPGIGAFDPARVQTLVVNVRMRTGGAVYRAAIDRVIFDGPETPLPPETALAVYRSQTLVVDADGDRVADEYETGTGLYVSPMDTGTRADQADSDGDGVDDGDELLMGTDPNLAISVFGLSGVGWVSATEIELRWPAVPGWRYTVDAAEEVSLGTGGFYPVPGLVGLTTSAAGELRVWDEPPVDGVHRFYRVSAEPAF